MLRSRSRIIDVAVSAAFTIVLVAEQALLSHDSSARAIVAAGLALVLGVSLAFRRRWPLASYLVGTAALISSILWSGPTSVAPYANLVGAFSLGLYGSRLRALTGPVILVPGVLVYFASTPDSPAVVVASVLAVWLAGWALGYQLARGREQSEAARAAARREAMADERVIIARELHDVVGHTVNLMLVQSGATRLVMDSDPAKAKELLVGVENAARQALGELDQLLGLLRDDDDSVTQPGLRELPALVDRLGEAGLAVILDVDTQPLPPQLDVVVYRIVQEALTNTLRHGAATSATVRVRGTRELVIEVDDNGHGDHDYTPGRGLRGMAERAALFGGTVEHSSNATGFHLRARVVVP